MVKATVSCSIEESQRCLEMGMGATESYMFGLKTFSFHVQRSEKCCFKVYHFFSIENRGTENPLTQSDTLFYLRWNYIVTKMLRLYICNEWSDMPSQIYRHA
jgi:hypothetical protein